MKKPSSIRSILVIESGDLHSLEEKILRVREAIFRHAEHPSHYEWVEMDNARTEEEYNNLYWHEFEDIIVTADAECPSSPKAMGGYSLLINTDDGSVEAEIDFGFDNTFNLELGFIDLHDKAKKEMAYRSSRLSLTQMNDEEAVIINHYLDQYLERASEPQLEPSSNK